MSESAGVLSRYLLVGVGEPGFFGTCFIHGALDVIGYTYQTLQILYAVVL